MLKTEFLFFFFFKGPESTVLKLNEKSRTKAKKLLDPLTLTTSLFLGGKCLIWGLGLSFEYFYHAIPDGRLPQMSRIR